MWIHREYLQIEDAENKSMVIETRSFRVDNFKHNRTRWKKKDMKNNLEMIFTAKMIVIMPKKL